MIKWIRRLVCDHDFRVQPYKKDERWHYPCHHGCGAVKKGPVHQYDYNNVEDERKAGR